MEKMRRRMIGPNATPALGIDLQPNRVANVVGLADVDPFVKGDPMAPQNRRMSIILLAEQQG